HSIMYIFAVALQDGRWHHIDSYAKKRVSQKDTIRLWHKISTKEDSTWTNRYHAQKASEKSFGGRVEVIMMDGQIIADEIAVANAHPLGAKPFARNDYIRKFKVLTDDFLPTSESNNFLETVQNLQYLTTQQLQELNPVVSEDYIKENTRAGIF
ncbi:MAG: MmgE/PrpD family protein, partial [Alphaproteobacteria bacterium]|nr:MmgE/PrpD family protein [Alphaproteobacteria bacterium]